METYKVKSDFFNEFRQKLEFKNQDTDTIQFHKVNNKNQIIVKTNKNDRKKIIGKDCPLIRKIQNIIFKKNNNSSMMNHIFIRQDKFYFRKSKQD